MTGTKLTWMVNYIIEELMDLDMEPKRESLWWTSTYKDEDERTLPDGSHRYGWCCWWLGCVFLHDAGQARHEHIRDMCLRHSCSGLPSVTFPAVLRIARR